MRRFGTVSRCEPISSRRSRAILAGIQPVEISRASTVTVIPRGRIQSFDLLMTGAHRRRKKCTADARRVFSEEREGLASCDCFLARKRCSAICVTNL